MPESSDFHDPFEHFEAVDRALSEVLRLRAEVGPAGRVLDFLEVLSREQPKIATVVKRMLSELDAGEFLNAPSLPIELRVEERDDQIPGADEKLEPGSSVGDYRVGEVVGEGGMGTVYRARLPGCEQDVALKLLRPVLSAIERARLEREHELLKSLDHPGIVRYLDISVEDRRPFVVMEFVEGQSLEQELQEGPLSLGRFYDVAVGVVDALRSAHRANVIHRDIKPSNILVDSTGTVKLVDFGIARPVRTDDGDKLLVTLTKPGQILGTPKYLSPEQARGERVDAAADIYNCGVLFYELLTGALPRNFRSVADLLSTFTEEDITPISELRESVPTELATLIHECLAISKDDRPSGRALRNRLWRSKIRRRSSGS